MAFSFWRCVDCGGTPSTCTCCAPTFVDSSEVSATQSEAPSLSPSEEPSLSLSPSGPEEDSAPFQSGEVTSTLSTLWCVACGHEQRHHQFGGGRCVFEAGGRSPQCGCTGRTFSYDRPDLTPVPASPKRAIEL